MVRNRIKIENDHKSQEKLDKHNDKEEEKDNKDNVLKCNKNDEFKNNVQILRNYSFLFVNTNEIFEMHALMQLITRK